MRRPRPRWRCAAALTSLLRAWRRWQRAGLVLLQRAQQRLRGSRRECGAGAAAAAGWHAHVRAAHLPRRQRVHSWLLLICVMLLLLLLPLDAQATQWR